MSQHADDPAMNTAPILVNLTGAMSTRITHVPSGTVIESAMAQEYGGPGGSFSSTDLVAAALGSCIATNLGPVAERHAFPLDRIELRLRKELSGQPKRINRLNVWIRIRGDVTPDLRTRFATAANTCTVHRSLHPDLDCRIQFEYDD
jgi:putative redox protein